MGLFDGIVDEVENALDVGEKVVTLEWDRIDRREVARLIASGMTVAAIAHAAGVAEDVVQAMIDDA